LDGKRSGHNIISPWPYDCFGALSCSNGYRAADDAVAAKNSTVHLHETQPSAGTRRVINQQCARIDWFMSRH